MSLLLPIEIVPAFSKLPEWVVAQEQPGEKRCNFLSVVFQGSHCFFQLTPGPFAAVTWLHSTCCWQVSIGGQVLVAWATFHCLCASQQAQGDLYSTLPGFSLFWYRPQGMGEISSYFLVFSSVSTHPWGATEGMVATLSTRGREVSFFLQLEKPYKGDQLPFPTVSWMCDSPSPLLPSTSLSPGSPHHSLGEGDTFCF